MECDQLLFKLRLLAFSGLKSIVSSTTFWENHRLRKKDKTYIDTSRATYSTVSGEQTTRDGQIEVIT